jgi:hypothetical protein
MVVKAWKTNYFFVNRRNEMHDLPIALEIDRGVTFTIQLSFMQIIRKSGALIHCVCTFLRRLVNTHRGNLGQRLSNTAWVWASFRIYLTMLSVPITIRRRSCGEGWCWPNSKHCLGSCDGGLRWTVPKWGEGGSWYKLHWPCGPEGGPTMLHMLFSLSVIPLSVDWTINHFRPSPSYSQTDSELTVGLYDLL